MLCMYVFQIVLYNAIRLLEKELLKGSPLKDECACGSLMIRSELSWFNGDGGHVNTAIILRVKIQWVVKVTF